MSFTLIKFGKSETALGAITKALCMPAAQELGEYFGDAAKAWRKQNAEKIAKGTIDQINERKIEGSVPPKVIWLLLNAGSLNDDELLQRAWSGLLVSSITPDGQDQSNLMYMGVLKQLAPPQVKLLNYACENVKMKMRIHGLIGPDENSPLTVSIDEAKTIAGVDDAYQLDAYLDHMRSLELIFHGINDSATGVHLLPVAFGVNLYIRCNGSRHTLADFNSSDVEDQETDLPEQSTG